MDSPITLGGPGNGLARILAGKTHEIIPCPRRESGVAPHIQDTVVTDYYPRSLMPVQLSETPCVFMRSQTYLAGIPPAAEFFFQERIHGVKSPSQGSTPE